jgi:hypothetical protein
MTGQSRYASVHRHRHPHDLRRRLLDFECPNFSLSVSSPAARTNRPSGGRRCRSGRAIDLASAGVNALCPGVATNPIAGLLLEDEDEIFALDDGGGGDVAPGLDLLNFEARGIWL